MRTPETTAILLVRAIKAGRSDKYMMQFCKRILLLRPDNLTDMYRLLTVHLARAVDVLGIPCAFSDDRRPFSVICFLATNISHSGNPVAELYRLVSNQIRFTCPDTYKVPYRAPLMYRGNLVGKSVK